MPKKEAGLKNRNGVDDDRMLFGSGKVQECQWRGWKRGMEKVWKWDWRLSVTGGVKADWWVCGGYSRKIWMCGGVTVMTRNRDRMWKGSSVWRHVEGKTGRNRGGICQQRCEFKESRTEKSMSKKRRWKNREMENKRLKKRMWKRYGVNMQNAGGKERWTNKKTEEKVEGKLSQLL